MNDADPAVSGTEPAAGGAWPAASASTMLPAPLAVHRAGEASVLAEYPGTAEVLAAAASVRAAAPVGLIDLVPAERTLLLRGTVRGDVRSFAALLAQLPAADAEDKEAGEVRLPIVYDGDDLAEVADLLGITPEALVAAHAEASWTAAFGGFAPGFAYLLPTTGPDPSAATGPSTATGTAVPALPWDVPRRAEPRTAVPPGAVGLASRYCGVYPRSSPGGWQLIGRTDAVLFDPSRERPALLSPGTRVRFSPRRAIAQSRGSLPARAAALPGRAAALPGRAAALPGRVLRRPAAASRVGRRGLTVLSAGPLTLLEDGGRAGQGSIGVSGSGAFDRTALVRANLAVGNPALTAALEMLVGPLRLRALEPVVLAVAGAPAPVAVRRGAEDEEDLELSARRCCERPIALDAGDRIEIGPVASGLRTIVAIRGGIRPAQSADGEHGAVLGSLSRDTLSSLGPEPLSAEDVLLVGPGRGLSAIPPPNPRTAIHTELGADDDPSDVPSDEHRGEQAGAPDDRADGSARTAEIVVDLVPGPRDALLASPAMDALLAPGWTVRGDSDRVGVRLEGPPLPVSEGAATLPSEAAVPGAVQVPPSGLPVVFGPDHPTTGGYPVIGVVTRAGLDLLAQAEPGAVVRFRTVGAEGASSGRRE